MNTVLIFNNLYSINALGEIYSFYSKKFVNPVINKGYKVITLWNNGKPKQFRLHRLIALNFIPNPENKPQINHKDGNKLNNALDNLEWVTVKENTIHAWENKLCKYKESELRRINTSKSSRKFSLEIEFEIQQRYINEDISQNELAKIYKCSRFTIMKIVNNSYKIKAATT